MAKHEETYVDLDQPYEQNIIGMRGIIYFGLGLFLLIVVTFGLMWIFQFQVLQPDMEARNEADTNPMGMSAKERIPEGMQLQSAPGFGITDPRTGERISLELREPQAEYQELMKIWEDQWENGEKVIVTDKITGEKKETIVSLPIKDAKEKFLANTNVKAKNDAEGEKALQEAGSMISASSAGRTRTDIKR